MMLELNVFNMCKRPRDIEDEDIELIEPNIKEQIQDEKFRNSMEIYFADSFESSKEFKCNIVKICSILDCTQVFEDDSGQLKFEDMIHLEETKEEKAPK